MKDKEDKNSTHLFLFNETYENKKETLKIGNEEENIQQYVLINPLSSENNNLYNENKNIENIQNIKENINEKEIKEDIKTHINEKEIKEDIKTYINENIENGNEIKDINKDINKDYMNNNSSYVLTYLNESSNLHNTNKDDTKEIKDFSNEENINTIKIKNNLNEELNENNKTCEILFECLEKQMQTIQENAKNIFSFEQKMKKYLLEYNKCNISPIKLNIKENEQNILNEEDILKDIFTDITENIENKNDLWIKPDYTYVEDVDLLSIDEEAIIVNKLNAIKEANKELKKKKHRRKLLKLSGERICEDYEREIIRNNEDEYKKELFEDNILKNDFTKSKTKTEEKEINVCENDKEIYISCIDKSFIQVPLKCILNNFRHVQKEIEKNIMIITLFIQKKLILLNNDEIIEKLDTIIEKLKTLKVKINDSKLLLNKYVKRLFKRLQYIYYEADIQLESLKKNFHFDTYEIRMNWLIDELLLKYGLFETQHIFCKRYNLQNFTDVDVYKEYLDIIHELKNHNTKKALEWCLKYKSQLKKLDANIESELHLQHVINLIFEKKYIEAIDYIKKNVPISGKRISFDTKFLITHIALKCSNKSLKTFNKKRWRKLLILFKNVFSEITGILSKPILEILLKAGISVIKTEQCINQTSTKCPTCISELNKTLQLLPFIQKTKSFLVCPYTNQVMDENNPPFTTPSGQVYSEKAICLFMKSDDLFQCPITEETYRLDEFSRLFI